MFTKPDSIVAIDFPQNSSYTSILSSEALDFLNALHHKFNDRRVSLLAEREKRQLEIDGG